MKATRPATADDRLETTQKPADKKSDAHEAIVRGPGPRVRIGDGLMPWPNSPKLRIGDGLMPW
jgi:hypothetical protein